MTLWHFCSHCHRTFTRKSHNSAELSPFIDNYSEVMNIMALRDACVALPALCKSTNLNLRCTEFLFCLGHGSHQTNLVTSKLSSLGQGYWPTSTNEIPSHLIPGQLTASGDPNSTTTTKYGPLQGGGQVKSLFLQHFIQYSLWQSIFTEINKNTAESRQGCTMILVMI